MKSKNKLKISVGSKYGDISGSPHEFEKNHYSLGESSSDGIKGSIDKDDYGPAVFELDSHDDTDDIIDKYKNYEHEEKHLEEDGKEHESSAKVEKSKDHEVGILLL